MRGIRGQGLGIRGQGTAQRRRSTSRRRPRGVSKRLNQTIQHAAHFLELRLERIEISLREIHQLARDDDLSFHLHKRAPSDQQKLDIFFLSFLFPNPQRCSQVWTPQPCESGRSVRSAHSRGIGPSSSRSRGQAPPPSAIPLIPYNSSWRHLSGLIDLGHTCSALAEFSLC